MARAAFQRKTAPAGAKTEQIFHLHAFRAFAIISIVAVHALSFGINIAPHAVKASDGGVILNGATQALFHGGTLYFAMISGILFSVALKARGWRKFFSGKISNVLAPYFIITLLMEVFEWSPTKGLFVVEQSLGDFAANVASDLLNGTGSFQFWYIPVLAALYLLTPAVDWTLRERSRKPLAILLVLLPILVTRTGSDVSAQSVIYFLGAYTLGVWLGSNYEASMAIVRARRAGLFIAFLLSSAAIGGLFLVGADYLGPISARESAYYIQKGSLALLVLDWLKSNESRTKLLDTVATHSFPTYFMHVSIINIVGRSARVYFGPPESVLAAIALGLVLFAVGLGVSIFISMGMKRLLGRRSRWLIGA